MNTDPAQESSKSLDAELAEAVQEGEAEKVKDLDDFFKNNIDKLENEKNKENVTKLNDKIQIINKAYKDLIIALITENLENIDENLVIINSNASGNDDEAKQREEELKADKAAELAAASNMTAEEAAKAEEKAAKEARAAAAAEAAADGMESDVDDAGRRGSVEPLDRIQRRQQRVENRSEAKGMSWRFPSSVREGTNNSDL